MGSNFLSEEYVGRDDKDQGFECLLERNLT